MRVIPCAYPVRLRARKLHAPGDVCSKSRGRIIGKTKLQTTLTLVSFHATLPLSLSREKWKSVAGNRKGDRSRRERGMSRDVTERKKKKKKKKNPREKLKLGTSDTTTRRLLGSQKARFLRIIPSPGSKGGLCSNERSD